MVPALQAARGRICFVLTLALIPSKQQTLEQAFEENALTQGQAGELAPIPSSGNLNGFLGHTVGTPIRSLALQPPEVEPGFLKFEATSPNLHRSAFLITEDRLLLRSARQAELADNRPGGFPRSRFLAGRETHPRRGP